MAASILIKISQISVRVLNLKGIFVIVFETDPLFVGRHLGFSSKFIEIKLNRVNRSAIHFWKQICLAFFVGNKPLPVYPQFFFFFSSFRIQKRPIYLKAFDLFSTKLVLWYSVIHWNDRIYIHTDRGNQNEPKVYVCVSVDIFERSPWPNARADFH